MAAAGYGVSQTMKSEANLGDLGLANVEALAQGESGGREDCEPAYDICCELVIYPDGSYGEDCLLDHKKKPGWL
ncbi:NVEALA domain-containing protein [Proteiniphilum sp. X52]|uniref:NVEALA domain-containing protein n=1 Tax=Proteiniphilum sp. X52 TaxID=2382159 RepID=UPI002100B4DB|nr:NVEALA domain-containing protein [Proteiniphilum sp. X52]